MWVLFNVAKNESTRKFPQDFPLHNVYPHVPSNKLMDHLSLPYTRLHVQSEWLHLLCLSALYHNPKGPICALVPLYARVPSTHKTAAEKIKYLTLFIFLLPYRH